MHFHNNQLVKITAAIIPAAIFILSASRQLFDASVGYPDADRILMDGVFIADFLRDLPLSNPIEYALTYYAQYPALSIGYRPPFFPFIESLFILIFGEHIWSGRLALMSLALVGGGCFFALLARMYGRLVALTATSLLASLPFITSLSWYTLADLPALSMMLITAYLVWCYTQGDGDRYAYLAAISFALTLWTKQTTIFMLLWIIPYLLLQPGRYRLLLSRASIISGLLLLILVLPLAAMTLYFADMNIAQSIGINPRGGQASRLSPGNLMSYPLHLVRHQLTIPVLAMSLFGFTLGLRHKDRHLLFYSLLIISTYIFFTLLNDPHLPRYTIYWLAAFSAFAATPLHYVRNTPFRYGYLGVVILTLIFNITSGFNQKPKYIDGYSEAAVYTVSNNKSRTVLVDAWNNGYFTFFMRKHDPERKLFVLRGDKLFTSSAIEATTWLKIHANTEEDILGILNKNNVHLVVVEERDYTGVRIHKIFRNMLRGNNFRLRASIPIRSNLGRFSDQSLKIYEFTGSTNSKPGDLNMELPVIGKSILVPADGGAPRLLPLNNRTSK
jgi:hypothetical protein